MLTSVRGLTAATISAGLLLSAAPAFASEASASEAAASAPSEEAVSAELIAASDAIETATPSDGVVIAPAKVDRASVPVDAEAASNAAGESGITFSGNIAFTSEYRFRGVDLSGGEFAVQGGFDLGHSSGFYVGTWASSLDEQTVGYGSTELDLYGGWSGDLTDGLAADIGVIAYLYPDAGPGDFDYVEFYASLSADVGPAGVSAGVAYAPDQDSLGSTDNLYLYTDVSVAIPDTPLTLNGHLGYTDGFLTFTTDSQALDWSIGADLAIGPATLSAAYVGVESDSLIDPSGIFTDDAFVITLSAGF